MKSFFTNEEFEDFLKTNSDRLQMRPSERVWKAIADDLNRKRRRIGWFTGLFLLAISAVGYYLSTNPAIHPVDVAGNQHKTIPSAADQSTVDAGITTTNSIITTEQQTPVNTGEQRRDENARVQSRAISASPLYVAYRNTASVSSNTTATTEAGIADLQPAEKDLDLNAFEQTIVDNDPESSPDQNETNLAKTENIDPQSIESVINSFRSKQKRSKLNWEIFFTPTISYRKLSENKSYMHAAMQSPTPVTNSNGVQALYNINDAVTHKPNVGLELGMAAKYPVAENIRLKGGLQFNMSRYDIKAFTNYTEAATMAFRDGNTTLSATNYRNLGGNNPDWLQNVYFQVSAPVGVEVKFGKNRRTQFGVASTIQPTYMIGDRAYLISTDYKNYVEVPWLVRRWNVNTALETFISYSTGKMSWQVGPQVRYQLQSSFISNYPVKENLFDFGLKIGVTLNKGNSSSGSKE